METLGIEKILWIKKGEGVAAAGRVPAGADYFQDHFPDLPILPGVLSLEILKRTAECYLRNENPAVPGYSVKAIKSAKFSSYLRPGDEWESRLELVAGGASTEWKADLFHQGRAAASARLILEPQHE